MVLWAGALMRAVRQQQGNKKVHVRLYVPLFHLIKELWSPQIMRYYSGVGSGSSAAL